MASEWFSAPLGRTLPSSLALHATQTAQRLCPNFYTTLSFSCQHTSTLATLCRVPLHTKMSVKRTPERQTSLLDSTTSECYELDLPSIPAGVLKSELSTRHQGPSERQARSPVYGNVNRTLGLVPEGATSPSELQLSTIVEVTITYSHFLPRADIRPLLACPQQFLPNLLILCSIDHFSRYSMDLDLFCEARLRTWRLLLPRFG